MEGIAQITDAREPGYCPLCGEPAGERGADGQANCAFGHTVGRDALLTEAEVFARWCAEPGARAA